MQFTILNFMFMLCDTPAQDSKTPYSLTRTKLQQRLYFYFLSQKSKPHHKKQKVTSYHIQITTSISNKFDRYVSSHYNGILILNVCLPILAKDASNTHKVISKGICMRG